MSFFNIFGKKPNPDEVFTLSDDFDVFFNKVSKRKYWCDLDINILLKIRSNADGELEYFRNFIFISEKFNLVRKNFLKFTSPDLMQPISLYADTLYNLGQAIVKQAIAESDPDSAQLLFMFSDMAYFSATLCNPFHLFSYVGLTIIHGNILKNKLVGLEMCQKYKDAEKKLLSTPDSQLYNEQRVIKEWIKNPNEMEETAEKIKKFAPNINIQAVGNVMNSRQIVEIIEKELIEL